MVEVTLEESITAFYKWVFKRTTWERAFNVNITGSQRERRDYYLPLIIEMANQGRNYYEIAQEIGVPKPTIYHWLKGVGIDARKRKGTEAEN